MINLVVNNVLLNCINLISNKLNKYNKLIFVHYMKKILIIYAYNKIVLNRNYAVKNVFKLNTKIT